MKAILMSIHPRWVKEIFVTKRKTIEVRKTAPKLETPFTVYVYQTKHKGGKKIVSDVLNSVCGGGKVIGEFVCDRINEIYQCNSGCVKENACLSQGEFFDYLGIPRDTHGWYDKKAFGWHITEPKLFDKPKEFYEFSKFGFKDAGGCCINYKCSNYIDNGWMQPPECKIDGCQITRAPQSFMYIDVDE